MVPHLLVLVHEDAEQWLLVRHRCCQIELSRSRSLINRRYPGAVAVPEVEAVMVSAGFGPLGAGTCRSAIFGPNMVISVTVRIWRYAQLIRGAFRP
jgi:hypothetical protein